MTAPTKSFKQITKEAMFTALVKAVEAMKDNNVDNGVLRECKALHNNTTFDDLPAHTKSALNASVETFVSKMIAEGYSVSAKD